VTSFAVSAISESISQYEYSWWSDPTSLFLISIILLVFFGLVISAWRSPERERTTQPQRPQSSRPSIEVSVEPFVNALKSPDWEARLQVVSVLGNMDNDNAVAPLMDVLLRDDNEQVRETAAVSLGHIGGERAVPALVKMVKNYLAGTEQSTRVVFASATALGGIGSAEGVAVLKKLAESLEQGGARENLTKVKQAIKDIELANDLTNKKCIVCNLPLGRSGELVQCPFCRNIAHKDHMLGWLSGREYCPTCGKPLRESALLQVRRKLPAPSVKAQSETKKQ
jgi:hypothetical protein